jgi:hypothetical protein
MPLLPYAALTRQPLAIKGLIPFKTHGRIDPFNVAQFALQIFSNHFIKQNKRWALILLFLHWQDSQSY